MNTQTTTFVPRVIVRPTGAHLTEVSPGKWVLSYPLHQGYPNK